MSVRVLLTVFFALWGTAIQAQGFAGLGETSDDFAQPKRGYQFDFPADHGAHPAYRIEWWYLTANLRGEDGKDYGLQWTLFRSALAPVDDGGWDSRQLWMGHAAVTTPSAHYVSERLARGGIGQAGVTAQPFDAWIDNWHLKGDFDTLDMRAAGAEFSYDMALHARGPLVFHGDDGFSVKSAAGQASYYYSQPFFDIEGVLDLPGGAVKVTGSAWLDREWSSQPLSGDQTGWDWFSLSFDDGAKLMGFQLRSDAAAPYTSATWITRDGAAQAIPDGDFDAVAQRRADVAGRSVPVGWRVRLPSRDVDVLVEAVNDAAWMATSVPYWEGPVRVTGSHSGRGYLEMTGY